MELKMLGKPIETLLVEDNPGEVRLTQEALRDGKMQNNSPDIILLDLNLPKISGLLLWNCHQMEEWNEENDR